MCRKRFLGILLIAFSVLLGACGKSDADKSSVNPGANSNSVAVSENSGETNKESGGQLTVVAGADKSAVKIRSTRFR